ncbi:hypothetical protein [Mucilaginibacter sp. 3215]|uniref:hypothetical protein n=1 Tax=Mucilaginibacter sp. 3215 TaxID=3373912 RepID=UPI003D2018D8
MEVATVITSNKDIVSLFDTFIYSFPEIRLVSKDHDTAFFQNVKHHRGKLYYHFELDDVEQEFSVNYKVNEVNFIKTFFKEKKIFMFDLSYTSDSILTDLFRGFKEYLIAKNDSLPGDILIGHPFDGIKKFEIDY